MLHKTRGIVFHQIKYSESSVIVKIYTEKLGIQSYLVKGIRKKNPTIKPGYFQALTLLDLVVNKKEKKDLQFIKEIRLAYPFNTIHQNIVKSAVALFLNEILYKSIREEEANQKLFDFLYNTIKILDITDESLSLFHLIFMLQLSKYLGFFPKENYSEKDKFFNLQDGEFQPIPATEHIFLNEKQSRYLNILLSQNFENHSEITIQKNIRDELTIEILKYYQLHISGFSNLKSLPVLSEVLKQ